MEWKFENENDFSSGSHLDVHAVRRTHCPTTGKELVSGEACLIAPRTQVLDERHVLLAARKEDVLTEASKSGLVAASETTLCIFDEDGFGGRRRAGGTGDEVGHKS